MKLELFVEALKPSDMPKTLATVNKYLRSKGVKEKVVRGRGYYYFIDGNAYDWPSQSVYVYRASDISLGDWYDHWKELSEA